MKIIRPITSLLLATAVVVASIGAVINSHICGGHVRSVALFAKAKSCPGMTEREQSNHCCKTKTVLLKAKPTAAVVKQALTPSFDVVAVISSFVNTISCNFTQKHARQYVYYKPPLICKNIPVLFQSFLI